MKVSFKTGKPLDTKQLLRMTGVLQGVTLSGMAASIRKGRLKSFQLQFDDLTVNYPPKEGELAVEI